MTNNPFPGLRSFNEDEDQFFFGRDAQSDEILKRLRCNRFVAVVGTSGSGKSSLIKAGVLPSLHGGFMVNAGSRWRIALFRPGNNPIHSLAKSLLEPGVLIGDAAAPATDALNMETTLRRSALGLTEAVRQARMPAHENLLIVVDQFEELFRFKSSREAGVSEDDDAAFVKLLIEATRQEEAPIYVVITMRSDFLGECARFRDLPDAINQGLHLIPLMTRAQHKEAIAGPVAVGGATMSAALVNRVLNEIGENPERLPIMQHALMRTWTRWDETHTNGQPLELSHYENIGGMAEALSKHADEAFNELTEAQQKIAEGIFRTLAEKRAGNLSVRRPTKLSQICAITEATQADVIAIIERFRGPGRSFLMPPSDVPLDSESLIDISHESLIGGWKRLRDWVEGEALSAAIYRRVADTADLYEKGSAGLWRNPDLQVALGWRDKAHPNKAWGEHCNPEFNFEMAMRFLERSNDASHLRLIEREQQRKAKLRRSRVTAGVLGLLLLVATVMAAIAFGQKVKADSAKGAADIARAIAVEKSIKAEKAEAEANKQKDLVDKAKQKAEGLVKDLQKEVEVRQAAELKASESARRAEIAKNEAVRQANIANARNNLFHSAVERATDQNQQDMATIRSLADSLIERSSPAEAAKWRTTKAAALTDLRLHTLAEQELTLALKVNPDDVNVRMTRGYMYMLTKKVPESIKDFNEIIKADPQSSLAYLNRAISQGIIGDYDDASSSTRDAIKHLMPGTYGALSENEVSEQISNATGYKKIIASEDDFETALHYELVSIKAFQGRGFSDELERARKRPASMSAYLTAIIGPGCTCASARLITAVW